MYKISVPVQTKTLDEYGRETVLRQLREAGAERVFLCPAGDSRFWDDHEKELVSLKRNIEFFKNEGFETGVWVWTFMLRKAPGYAYMTSPAGAVSDSCVCPTDKGYREKMGKFIETVAAFGIDIFMFDDDYRYGFIDIGFGCCCDNHLKMISEDLGEEVTREILCEKILSGGKNRYRDAFLRANGKALEDFAEDMRRHLDKVDPSVRMGFCSCINSWDIDGTHPDRIAEKLAGDTKPFYRLIGAPYWANDRNWGNRLADVIDFERMESSRRKNTDIEIFSEGDTYPRPRFRVPAAFLEGFDTALIAAGCTDGILKYMIDYTSHPLTETGYIDRHIKNRETREIITRMFSDKESAGIRVWDKADKFADILIPREYEGKTDIQNIEFPAGARMLAACSLPAVYGAGGVCGLAFGDDARAVPENERRGLILDLRAAEILSENGTDTGVVSAGKTLAVSEEVFLSDGNRVATNGGTCRETAISDKAVTESVFVCGGKEYPASYRYENENGERFLVFCFDAYLNSEGLMRQYPRARQIAEAVPYLGGKELPAVCAGHPDLYIQVKRSGGKTAVGLWNFFPDEIERPRVTLCFEPEKVTCPYGETVIDGKTVTLPYLPPYGFVCFEAE